MASTSKSAHLQPAGLHWRHWTIVGLSFALTVGVWHISKQAVLQEEELRFDGEVDVVLGIVEERVAKYEEALGAGMALLDNLGGNIDQPAWHAYTESLRISERYPGISDIGVYFAHEPSAGPAGQLAGAATQELVRHAYRQAAEQAITLIRGEGGIPRLLLCAPFRTGGEDLSQPGASPRVEGMVYAPFSPAELLTGVVGQEHHGIDLRIVDGDRVLYNGFGAQRTGSPPSSSLKRTASVPAYGRLWQLEFEPTQFLPEAQHAALPGVILAGGFLIDGLVLASFLLLSQARRRALESATQAEAQLQDRESALEESNQHLENFAYVASHDLQEPLRMVSSFAELLDAEYQSHFDDQGRLWLGFMIDGASRMQALVHGLLEYSRVSTKPEEPMIVDLDHALSEVLQDLAAEMNEAGTTFTHDPLPRVFGPQQRLGQVLQVILSNAIKFRRPGEDSQVHLSCTVEDGRARIAIQDNGIGIDPKYSEKVFVLFERLHGRSEYAGSGLGLAIAKKIIDGMGGQLWFEPAQPTGTKFLLDIPTGPTETYVLPRAQGAAIAGVRA